MGHQFEWARVDCMRLYTDKGSGGVQEVGWKVIKWNCLFILMDFFFSFFFYYRLYSEPYLGFGATRASFCDV